MGFLWDESDDEDESDKKIEFDELFEIWKLLIIMWSYSYNEYEVIMNFLYDFGLFFVNEVWKCEECYSENGFWKYFIWKNYYIYYCNI